MSRTILNIDGTRRTINPRNGTSVFVDLTSNQSIGGIKRFLNNLITNSDVNFNTTANLGRIIFNSNEPAGSGSQIVSIYTQDEIDGLGWFFDSVGNLYYLGGGLIPIKIMLSGGTGDLTILNTFNSGAINANGILSLRNTSSLTNILLNPITTSGNRLQVFGITSGTIFLYYNTSNNIGVFNTATGANVWSINGTTGDINTIGSISYASLSATSLLTNSISPISPSTTININTTSNFNFLKSVGVNRILMYPSSVAGDIMRITRTGDNAYGDGYWYWNNVGTLGYISSGVSRWEIGANGGFYLTNSFYTSSFIQCDLLKGASGATYINYINMKQLSQNASIGSIELTAQYICFAHPSSPTTTASKYLFISPASGNTTGDFYIGVNNVSQSVIATDIGSLRLVTDFIWEYRKPSFVSGAQYIRFINGGTIIGSVSMLTASTVNYNMSSDYRLKQDIKPLEKSLERLMKLQPKSYKFIKDVEDGQDFTFDGFLAHEVEDIVPMAVSGIKDDPDNFQQMDYSKLTPLLTGAVQELNKEVEELKIYNKSLLDIIDKLIIRVEKLEYNLT